MKFTNIELRDVTLPLVKPFVTTKSVVTERQSLLVVGTLADGTTCYGEVVAFTEPWYTEETLVTARHVLEQHLIPAVLNVEFTEPEQLQQRMSWVQRHHMAKAAIDMMAWDGVAKQRHQPLAACIGGVRSHIPAGIVVGAKTLDETLRQIEAALPFGYERYKVKVGPDNDEHILQEIRRHFPNLPLMIDANSAYRPEQMEQLVSLERFRLMMIEQPFAAGDFVEHARLQRMTTTAICLDESIHSLHDVEVAIALQACRIINVKIGRVGGITEALRIHQRAAEAGIQLWVGGMVETGVSRMFNIALATLPNFTIAGDISASARYFAEDIIEPAVVVENGRIRVPTERGIGVRVK